jgi:hypothetical protein
MKTIGLFALVLLAMVAASPAWAGGYLSDYPSGSRRYLSDYPSGGYYAGRSGGYKYYGGPHGRIERKHGRDWYRYQEALRRNDGDIEPGAGPSWARRRAIYNPMGIPLGWPAGSPEICGTYLRKPSLCYGQTTRYDPYIHGD